ncbi:MAG TPA: hypothetical protein VNH18_10885 [Bryobacteraceae bacterium]|nr:hypothetical protein [Bryobacteraceae bacterium]
MPTATLPRPAEKTAIVTMILVFLCGTLLGAFVMSRVHHSGEHAAALTATIGLSVSITEWKEQLDLSDEQVRQLTSILNDFGHYYDNLLADGNSRILQVLNPDQRLRYEKMIRDHRK